MVTSRVDHDVIIETSGEDPLLVTTENVSTYASTAHSGIFNYPQGWAPRSKPWLLGNSVATDLG